MKTKHKKNTLFTFSCFVLISLLFVSSLLANNIPDLLESITTEDGSVWERVSEPGFGNKGNIAITSLYPYKTRLYAITRNENSGFEIWRTQGTSWEPVNVPGFTDSLFHSRMNNGYGAMFEFNGCLYIAIGSGYEGAFLYSSVGFEMWRFDGENWEPIISNSKDEDESGTITEISGCSDDGNTTAEMTDSTKNWDPDQWKGGILRITSGQGKGRVFDILANTATTLTIQQNEVANTKDVNGNETEYTICDELVPDPDHPELTTGAITVQDSYEIGIGDDENGFGRMWNKNFVDMEILNGELYASIAHNYEEGTRIWKSSDGINWEPNSDYSFGLFHGFDMDGNETGICLIEGLEDRNGAPVCSSSTHFAKSDISGTQTLYVGGTGSSGCNGRGARVLRLDGNQWNFIVDYFVDDNPEGTNENGFGDAGSFVDSNFQAWSWEEYDDKLFLGVARVKGSRIMFTNTGGQEDGAWKYVVGGDSSVPDGFDGVSGFMGYGANIVPLLYVYDSALYAGSIVNSTSPPLFSKHVLDGADIWRATGPAESLVWSRITGDGFGDKTITVFSSFCTFSEALYVGGSNLFGNFPGNVTEGYQGAKVYRLKEAPRIASVSSIETVPETWSITLNWATDNETDCIGFNIYRSSSEERNLQYTKVNPELIPAIGSPTGSSTYTYTDKFLWFNKTYFYKIECVDSSGKSRFYGPLSAKTESIFRFGN